MPARDPTFRRPVVAVQGDAFKTGRLATVIVIPLTSNLRWAAAPGNVVLKGERAGCPRTRSPACHKSSRLTDPCSRNELDTSPKASSR
jgi:mRNA-degrading endonuclease toxin of MazEF toxin-antitoxin module